MTTKTEHHVYEGLVLDIAETPTDVYATFSGKFPADTLTAWVALCRHLERFDSDPRPLHMAMGSMELTYYTTPDSSPFDVVHFKEHTPQ